MKGETLQEVRKSLGVSFRRLAMVARCSVSTVFDKTCGRSPWKLDEARRVTAFLQTLDPEVSMDALFPEESS